MTTISVRIAGWKFLLLWMVSSGVAGQGVAEQKSPAPREQIGEVFGKPVYRDEIQEGEGKTLRSEVQRLFLAPVWEKYQREHVKEITPTEQEIATVARNVAADHRKRIADEEASFRERLLKIEQQLAQQDLTKDQRAELESEKSVIETKLQPPGRDFAVFLLSQWKFQKHLYDNYGGGRILWQQFGQEAFDATRVWLEAREKAGDFKIADPALRVAAFYYWTTQNHGAFLTDDAERIRSEFLEPVWLKDQK